MSHDATGLKHLGVGLGWVRLGDGSEPEADRVITACTIGDDDPTCGEHNTEFISYSILQLFWGKWRKISPSDLVAFLLPSHEMLDRVV